MPSLYAELLGASWSLLAPWVQRLHGGAGVARGVFTVRRGTNVLARVIGAVLGMPPAADATALTLAVAREGPLERWMRTFGERPLRTVQWAEGGLLVEEMGLFQCWFRLCVRGGALRFEQVRTTFGARRLPIPLPRALSPRIECCAAPASENRVRVEVRIHAPVAGLIVAYAGEVTPEGPGV